MISAALFGVEETPPERSLVLKPWRDEGVLPEGGLGVIEVEDGFFCKSEIECGCFAGFVTTKFSSYYESLFAFLKAAAAYFTNAVAELHF